MVFCAFCIFSSLMSDDILFSLKSSLFYFRIGVFSLFISYLISINKNILKHFYYTFIFTFSLLIFYAFIQYFFALQDHPYRISSFFGDELILGSYLSRLLPLIIALFFMRQNKSNVENLFFLTFLVVTYFCIFITGERAAFFYINMSLLFLIFFIRFNFKIFIPIIIIIATITSIFIFTNTNKEFKKLLVERYTINILSTMNLDTILNKEKKMDQLSIKKNSEYLDTFLTNQKRINKGRSEFIIFTSGHETLYRTAFNMFLDRPIIGHGPRMFRIKCSDPKYAEIVITSKHGSCMTHPHNFYIQLLAETGIIGFFFLFFLFIYISFLSIKYLYFNFVKKTKIYSDSNICILACLLITTWPIIPNGNFFTNYLIILYSLPVGFLKKEKI